MCRFCLEEQTTALLCGDLQSVWSQGSSERRLITRVQRNFPPSSSVIFSMPASTTLKMKKGHGCLCLLCQSTPPNIIQWTEKQFVIFNYWFGSTLMGVQPAYIYQPSLKMQKWGEVKQAGVEQGHALWRTDLAGRASALVSPCIWVIDQRKTERIKALLHGKALHIKQSYGWVTVFGSCSYPFFCVSLQRVSLAEVGWNSSVRARP